MALDPCLGDAQPYAAYYVAVALVAWRAGWQQAVVALVLGYLAGDWFFVPPRYALGVHDLVHATDLLMYVLVTGTVIVLIVSLRKTEASLRENEERFRVMAETIPDILFANRPDGASDYVNQRFEFYSGLGREEAGGFGWAKAVHPEEVAGVTAHWLKCVETGRVFEAEYRLRAADGSYRWFMGRAQPIRDERDHIVRWVGCCTDIDSQKRNAALLEQRIAERTAKLQQTVQELEGFSYSLSHDMRAPLRAMRSYAEIAQRECSHNQDALACDYLGRIIESAQRLDHLILDSLNYSQILRDELPVRTVELAGLLRGIIDSNPNLEPPAAEIRVAFKQLLVRGNEAALTQCFSNLLDNAVKFTAPNTKPRVNIRAQELTAQALLAEKQGPPKTVRVWVEDNGIGIPKDSQEMIFGMFQRMHPEQAYPGTGIGLAIVKKAVERMGGKVGVESEVNRGSRFWVELPAG